MGKFMKKARGVGGVIEVLRQGQLGVRTRARAQAIEKIKELITTNHGHGEFSSSTSAKSFAPTQISYLQLRSRRLPKTVGKSVGCAGNNSLSVQKSNSADACRQLSDVTNSDILADDSSRLTLSAEEARGTCRQTNYGAHDENREVVYHCYGDNEGEEEFLLHSCAKSLQQWGSRGRAPASVAQSRSNSRSNSVTRELPPPVHEHRPSGILTRNRRKMEKQVRENITCTNKTVDMDMDMEPYLFCHAHEVPASTGPANSCFARNVDVEVSFGEMTSDEGWSARDRFAADTTPINQAREVNMPAFSVRVIPECNKEAAPSNLASPLDVEIENFFQQAEQKEQRRFIKQYNFDPVADTPLPGRYDWISL